MNCPRAGTLTSRALGRRALLTFVGLTGLVLVFSCGEGAEGTSTRSAATGREQLGYLVLTEADAGNVIEISQFVYDIGLPDKIGLEIHLTGDDASTLRWRFAQKPDSLLMEWAKVDGRPASETDGLIGNPTTAAKVLEFRGSAEGEARVVLELVERDPAERGGSPAKRLEYTFQIAHEDPQLLGVPGMNPLRRD